MKLFLIKITNKQKITTKETQQISVRYRISTVQYHCHHHVSFGPSRYRQQGPADDIPGSRSRTVRGEDGDGSHRGGDVGGSSELPSGGLMAGRTGEDL